MKVAELMTAEVKSCAATDTLEHAARILWENDFGCLPVIDFDGHVVGMLTDRDICMAAYTRNERLNAMSVGTTMSRDVWSCVASETITELAALIKEHQVRRVPVLGEDGGLIGIITVADLVRAAAATKRGKKGVAASVIVELLGSIASPRS